MQRSAGLQRRGRMGATQRQRQLQRQHPGLNIKPWLAVAAALLPMTVGSSGRRHSSSYSHRWPGHSAAAPVYAENTAKSM